jgi:hypothetical protein
MKSKILYTISCLLILVTAGACNKDNKGDDPLAGLEKVTYTESDAVIPNPERGFYSTRETHKATSSPITATAINTARNAGRTLFLFEYYLTDYVASDIAENYLDLIRQNFAIIRENGAKALVRFAYSNGYAETDRPWDATEEQVLRHVAQLKPILQEYSDVIYVMQAGFVGSWGEWYYTENFNMNPITAEQYQPRKHLLDALLDALPENRQIEVRTPAFKMKIYGYALADTLTAAEAHTGTIKARIAGHNDCFLASSSDTGTFNGKTDREYWMAETRYTIMGGESCGLSQFCNCEDGETYDGAVTTLEKYHFSYLHIGYHPQVLSRWKQQNCFDEVDKRLGYRLVLRDAAFSEKAKAGEDFRVVLNMENVGFAAPMNPRDAFLVISSTDGKAVKSYPVSSDPRTWHSGTFTLDQTIKLPSEPGKYVLNLYLPDPEPTLKDNPRFAIQLANKDVWNDNTGYNTLKTLTIE